MCTEVQEDQVVIFEALAELARIGTFTAALNALYVNTLGTPLGRTLAHHLPHTKATWARPKSFVSQAEHLRILGQKLSVHIMQDYQGSPASESGSCVERGRLADPRHTLEDSEAR
jgi:hypothetical protein